MFFWLIAIPFFVIIAMFTLFRLPSNDLNQPEEIQDAAMAFRMALQHDAAAKLRGEPFSRKMLKVKTTSSAVMGVPS